MFIIIWIAPHSAAQVNLLPYPSFEDQHSIGVCWPDTTQLGMWPDSWIYPTEIIESESCNKLKLSNLVELIKQNIKKI